VGIAPTVDSAVFTPERAQCAPYDYSPASDCRERDEIAIGYIIEHILASSIFCLQRGCIVL
jgi:hypothetical protein